jgi:penicillin amidase
VVNLAGAVVVSALLLGVLGFGYGAIPALGPALDPGRGAWTSASGGQQVSSQRLHVPGLNSPVTVSYTRQGLASIAAASTHDVFLALGYVHARFRLSELDAERRLGEGRLAELAGPSDLPSDEFELRLGLLRTARNEWAQTTGASRAALIAYAQGVNDDIAEVRASGDWPALFSLSGQYPRDWTPVDSLVVQGVLTQELDYTTGPLDMALIARSLGPARTAGWFPTLAANAQTPYDPGPYEKLPLTPVAPDAASSVPLAGTTAAGTTGAGSAGTASLTAAVAPAGSPGSGGGAADSRTRSGDSTAAGAASALAQLSQLLPTQTHHYPDSNAWAANGPAVKGASAGQQGALLGGDPHLPQTLPSIWFEVSMSAPGYRVAGVSVPGMPGVLLGHNSNIAWSLTDTQNSATFYYKEQVRGSQYYYQGQWRPLTVVRYSIPVRGGAARQLTVRITGHGPVISQAGQTMAVDWMGNVPSGDLGALLAVNTAVNFTQFKAALAGWHAPSQNFVYADAAGHIGVIAPGYYPQVPAGCQPWLPMSGAGGCDITGVIPYQAVPQAYDPPSHLIATGNQRPVDAGYPYYVGTAYDFYDPGYRAAHAYAALRAAEPLTAGSIARLQNDLTDPLAVRLLPAVRGALSAASLSGADKAAAALLTPWNGGMDQGSAAASLWWTFWNQYLTTVFNPWWKSAKVPVSKDRIDLAVGPGIAPLAEDLEAWTLGDQSNAAFAGPSGHGPANARAAIVAAFRQTVSRLSAKLGGDPASWAWGRLHSRSFPSITGAAGLGYGPRPAGGDPYTEDAADGGLDAKTGPSWRMIVSLGGSAAQQAFIGSWTDTNDSDSVYESGSATPGHEEFKVSQAPSDNGIRAVGVYPGGQSENPASPWYDNLVPLWWDGKYLAIPDPGSTAGATIWRLDG